MKYLKIYTDFAEILEPFSETECGRLLKMMLAYAESGIEIDSYGREKTIWPIAKQMIDRSRKVYEKKVSIAHDNGKKHGKPISTEIDRYCTNIAPISVQEQEQEHNAIALKNRSGWMTDSEMDAAASENTATAITIQTLAEDFGLPTSPKHLDALRRLSEEYGMDRLQKALCTAMESSKTGLSLSYIRAILQNDLPERRKPEPPKQQRRVVGEDDNGNLIYG